MFCGNCGTQNDDHAVFCQNCGARLDAGGQNQNQQYQQNQQWQQQPVQPDNYSYQSESSAPVVTPKKNIGKLKILIPVVAVLAVVFLLFSLLGGSGGYEKPVDNFIQGALDKNAKKLVSAIPQAYIKNSGMSKKELISKIQESLDEAGDVYSLFGEDVDISYKIIDAEDIVGEDLQDIKDDCKESGVKVSAAKDVDVKATAKMESGTDSETTTIQVIKVGRKWYINIEELLGLL